VKLVTFYNYLRSSVLAEILDKHCYYLEITNGFFRHDWNTELQEQGISETGSVSDN